MKVTFLGTGTSQGVPVIACECEVCSSSDTRDKRLRCSVLIELPDLNIVIDTGPDFRQQMLREKVQRVDAVLFTHAHKDHVAGLDDIRAFNFKHSMDMQVYATQDVQQSLKREFHYVFAENPYPGIPKVRLHEIDKNPFSIAGQEIIPVEVMHAQLPVLGFRLDNFAYLTDAKTISEEEKSKLKGLDVLVLNALRRESHVSHLTLTEALEWVDELKPKQAYFTHLSHYLGTHDAVSKELPNAVQLAYDGLFLTV
jgi:phosphoribosyl 1,2-cyclic phosphate phosphodiesterase